jgi:hypothetical protein
MSKWRMANGEWQMANGKWRMANEHSYGRSPDQATDGTLILKRTNHNVYLTLHPSLVQLEVSYLDS